MQAGVSTPSAIETFAMHRPPRGKLSAWFRRLMPSRLARRFVRQQDGSAAVEFSLVAIPFLGLTFAILETALVFFAGQTLETAVTDSARLIMTGQAQDKSWTKDDFKTEVCSRIHGLFDCIGGVYVDQFTYAERATDWRGNNNIAHSLTRQCRLLTLADPSWVVCGAGTGGTSATIGRYLRYRGSQARLCIAEPAGAAFARGWAIHDRGAKASRNTCIEGIGRPRVEPGFEFELADQVVEVEDAASIAGAMVLETITGRSFGGSSGTNFVAALRLAAAMKSAGEQGRIVLLLCDRGERYAQTLFSPAWREQRGLCLAAQLAWLRDCCAGGAQFPHRS